MVAAKCLNPSFINLDFWRRIPGKFQGIRLYEDKKSKMKEVFLYLHKLVDLLLLRTFLKM